MRAIIFLLFLGVIVTTYHVGYYFGEIHTFPKAYKQGRRLGLGLGKMYYGQGDEWEKIFIESIFKEDIKYVEDQEQILRDKVKYGGLKFH